MRKLFILLTLTLLVTSCSKEDEEFTPYPGGTAPNPATSMIRSKRTAPSFSIRT